MEDFFKLKTKVERIVRRYCVCENSYADSLGEGLIGLMEGYSKYNPEKKDASPSYIIIRAKGAVKDYIRKEYKLKTRISFYEDYEEGNIKNLKDLWFQKTPHSIESDIYIRKFVLFLHSIMEKLLEDEKILLKEYYFNGKTMDEVGKIISLSKSGISKKHKKLIEFLKREFIKFCSNK